LGCIQKSFLAILRKVNALTGIMIDLYITLLTA
jgi:hypothetical protein